MTTVLDKAQIEALGIEGGWVLGLADFVKYSELDTYNHVNNKVYHTWFENARVLYLENTGIKFSLDSKIKPVVRSANIIYDAPMFNAEDYITLARVSRLGRTSFVMDYAVWCDGTIRITGDTTLVMVNDAATETRPVPDDLREIMITRDGAQTA